MGSMGGGGARIVVLLMRPGLAQDARRLKQWARGCAPFHARGPGRGTGVCGTVGIWDRIKRARACLPLGISAGLGARAACRFALLSDYRLWADGQVFGCVRGCKPRSAQR